MRSLKASHRKGSRILSNPLKVTLRMRSLKDSLPLHRKAQPILRTLNNKPILRTLSNKPILLCSRILRFLKASPKATPSRQPKGIRLHRLKDTP